MPFGIDPRTGLNPAVRLRKAKPYGHKGAVPEDTCLGMLAARDVSSRLLETTNEAFQSMIGTRPQGWLPGLKQRGSTGDGDLLTRGHHPSPCCRQTAGWKFMPQGQELSLSCLTACVTRTRSTDAAIRGNC